MAKTPPYPFIKWAGGKARMAKHVIKRLPEEINTYYEPLVGGGAVYFELAKKEKFKRAILADTSPELVNTWNIIKKDVENLIKELRKAKYEYEKKAFLSIRALDLNDLNNIQRAARFIYLNKTCFNGLYRVNLKGQFNTPFGKYKNPVICDANNLKAVSKCLKKTTIKKADFAKVCQKAKAGDAVYFDPPYIPISKTSKFTSYTTNRFIDEDHDRLAKLFRELGDKGVRVVLSNSSAPYAIKIFKDFDIDHLIGTRSIGGPAEYRNSAKEILVFHGPRA